MIASPIIHFVSGLPRSGSTLLCNLLNQNPRFYVTSTSGILDILFTVRNAWDGVLEFKASPNEEGKRRVLKGILESYYSDVQQPLIFDKSRGWLAYLEMAEMVLEREAKVLVPVRDLRDVIASFEKLWRKNSDSRQFGQEANNYFKWQTIEGRCEIWCSQEQPVGIAYNRIKDAIQRGFKDRLHFVPYEELTAYPAKTMAKIYSFLEEQTPFVHNFDTIEQTVFEDDLIHGIPDLHTIRTAVEPQQSQWQEILGDAGKQYAGLELW